MAVSMPSLPEELVENIAKQLHTIDICSLRVTCRQLAIKASRGCFRIAFNRKSIALGTVSLNKVNHLHESDNLNLLLQGLTVPCNTLHDGSYHTLACILDALTITCTSREEHDEANDLSLLSKCFTLHQFDLAGTPLKLLRARLTPEDSTELMESGWKAQSLTAGRLAKGILLALRESKLDVEHLDLFADQDYCSAPLAVIPACGNSVQGHFATPGHDSLKRYEIWPHFSAVRHLSSSFTHHRGNPLPRCGSLTGQVWALQALIEAMPNLESLTLHWYTLRRHTAEYVDTSIEQEWLNCSIFGLKLPSLRTLKLSGIHTRAAGLHTFLQNTSLTHLTLQELHLYSGAWKPLLEYISSADCTISFLQLDDLFAEDRLIYFKVPGEPKFRSRGDAIGPSEITRKGAEVKEKLEYAFGKGRLLGSPEANRWSKERMRRYGPPDRML